jgi:hypothetical protein
MTKRAVCVGINDYSARSDCSNLNGARPDAEAWAQCLSDGFDFDPAKVTVLKDGAASRSAVMSAIGNMLKQSDAGDVACFFFSGHGGRDQSSDGSTWVESICCADEGGDITNSDFDTFAASLQPSYVNFTLVLDSCHSGGAFDAITPGAKSQSWSQDIIDKFASSCSLIVPHICIGDASSLSGNVSVSKDGDSLSMSINSSLDFSDSAKATLFAACRYDQLSYDGAKHGAFTQALLDTINQCNFQVAHPDLLDKVRDAITNYNHSQIPQLRGRPVRLEENFLQGWTYSI